jgi:hypothetical protein
MPSAETLTNAALRLAEAVARHELERSVASADAVIAARLAVKEAFIEAGWQPSERALRQMQADRDLLLEGAGVLDRERADDRRERVRVEHVAPPTVRVVQVGGRPKRVRRTPATWGMRPLLGLA